jgi:hypothetical protein
MYYVFFFLFFGLSGAIYSNTNSKEKLLERYKESLPKHYIEKLNKLVVDNNDWSSRRMDQIENTVSLDLMRKLNNKNEDVLTCFKASQFGDLTIAEFQKVILSIASFVRNNAEQIPCAGNKQVMTRNEASELYSELLKNSLFNNSNPNGNCFDRAYLISKNIDVQGFKSQQIYIEGYIGATYRVGDGFSTESYPVHIANVVKIQDEKGNIQEYVFDPMYFDTPLRLEDYLIAVNIGDSPLTVKKLSQSFIPEGYDVYSKKDDRKNCHYNTFSLEDSLSVIKLAQSIDNSLTGEVHKDRKSSVSAFKNKYNLAQ